MSFALVAALHILLLAVLLVDVFPWLGSGPSSTAGTRRGRRPLRRLTPDDGPRCREVAGAPRSVASPVAVPYPQLKSRRGRQETVVTPGYACPHPECRYFNNTDPAVASTSG